MKYIIPSTAPSSVEALTSNVIIVKYGNIAKKYATFPELFTPRIITRNTIIHAASK